MFKQRVSAFERGRGFTQIDTLTLKTGN